MYVACPNCRGWMVGDGIPVGAAVLCPHCQKQFVMTQAILAAAMQGETQAPGSSATAPVGPRGEAGSAGLVGGLMGTSSQPTPPGLGPPLSSSGGMAGAAGPSPSPLGGPAGGWGMPSGGGPPQMPGMTPSGMPGTPVPGGLMPGMASSAMPLSMAGTPGQTVGYPQAAAPADREAQKPRPRRPLLGAEGILILGFSLMIVAIVIVVVIGYGGRPAFRHLGQSEQQASTPTRSGPQMKVSYEPRKGILYIENADQDWKEAELRINPDPADDEGGYRCQLGPMPRGRKKPVSMKQCLSPSGAPFQGQIERIVVIAKTVDGTFRYVSQVGPASE